MGSQRIRRSVISVTSNIDEIDKAEFAKLLAKFLTLLFADEGVQFLKGAEIGRM